MKNMSWYLPTGKQSGKINRKSLNRYLYKPINGIRFEHSPTSAMREIAEKNKIEYIILILIH